MAPSFGELTRRALAVVGLGNRSAHQPTPAVSQPTGTSWLHFEGQGPQWGFARWGLSGAAAQQWQTSGTPLSLRVADVTGQEGADLAPHALQEWRVAGQAGQWGVALPLGNRVYRAELGYHGPQGWVRLALAEPVAIAGHGDGTPAAPMAFEAFGSGPGAPAFVPPTEPESAHPALHERMYRTAMVRIRQVGSGSEVFHDLEIVGPGPGGLSDSGAGPWASGRNESGAGLGRLRSFWLVADAELIVYGATEPDATLHIGSTPVPLEADGSFRVQVPFRDGQQLYPIEAVAVDGEQRRSITLRFERGTPEDNSNPAGAAPAEWF